MAIPNGQTDEAKGSRPLVLVVDDDPELVKVLVEALAHKRYRVATASNGKVALERVEQERPQLILLDMTMPVMDGWTFARALHERYGRAIPIVVITAVEDSRLRADELGAESELGKPFTIDQLYDVVDDLVGGSEGAP